MIKSLRFTNYLGDSEVIELRSPEKSGFSITDILGITPTHTDITISDSFGARGGLLQSTRIGPRNIVLTLAFVETKKSIEELRLRTYEMFAIGKPLKIEIKTNQLNVECSGIVEGNQAVIFSNFCGTQISIICPDPNFYSLLQESMELKLVENRFSFPFWSNSEENSILFSVTSTNIISNIEYRGQVDVGCQFTIAIKDSNVYTIKISKNNRGIYETMILDLSKMIDGSNNFRPINGDTIYISTEVHNKYVQIFKNPTAHDGFKTLNTNVDWIFLTPGINQFIITAYAQNVDPLNSASVPIAGALKTFIKYHTVYEGV